MPTCKSTFAVYLLASRFQIPLLQNESWIDTEQSRPDRTEYPINVSGIRKVYRVTDNKSAKLS